MQEGERNFLSPSFFNLKIQSCRLEAILLLNNGNLSKLLFGVKFLKTLICVEKDDFSHFFIATRIENLRFSLAAIRIISSF